MMDKIFASGGIDSSAFFHQFPVYCSPYDFSPSDFEISNKIIIIL